MNGMNLFVIFPQSFHIRSSLLLLCFFLSLLPSICSDCSCSPCWMVLPAHERGGSGGVGGGCSRSMSTHDSVNSAECKFPVHNALRLLSLWNFCHLLCSGKRIVFLLFVFKAPSSLTSPMLQISQGFFQFFF